MEKNLLINRDIVDCFKFISWNHPNRIPGELPAGFKTSIAANTFVKPHLDGWNRSGLIFFFT